MAGDAKPTVEEAVAILHQLRTKFHARVFDEDRAAIRTLLADRTALVSRIKELEGALLRLGSSEAFDQARFIDGPLAAELRLRMDFASRAAARVITEEG